MKIRRANRTNLLLASAAVLLIAGLPFLPKINSESPTTPAPEATFWSTSKPIYKPTTKPVVKETTVTKPVSTKAPTQAQAQVPVQPSYNYLYNTTNTVIKIDCSFSDGTYYFNYGQQTYEDCRRLSDKYWGSLQNSTPTPNTLAPTSSPYDPQSCINEVNSRYNELVKGCHILYQGSAAVACERAYNKERNTALEACE